MLCTIIIIYYLLLLCTICIAYRYIVYIFICYFEFSHILTTRERKFNWAIIIFLFNLPSVKSIYLTENSE